VPDEDGALINNPLVDDDVALLMFNRFIENVASPLGIEYKTDEEPDNEMFWKITSALFKVPPANQERKEKNRK
jgi:hypothetical protein